MKLRRRKIWKIFLSKYACLALHPGKVSGRPCRKSVLFLDNFSGKPGKYCIKVSIDELFMGLYSGLRNVCSLSHSVNKLLMK